MLSGSAGCEVIRCYWWEEMGGVEKEEPSRRVGVCVKSGVVFVLVSELVLLVEGAKEVRYSENCP